MLFLNWKRLTSSSTLAYCSIIGFVNITTWWTMYYNIFYYEFFSTIHSTTRPDPNSSRGQAISHHTELAASSPAQWPGDRYVHCVAPVSCVLTACSCFYSSMLIEEYIYGQIYYTWYWGLATGRNKGNELLKCIISTNWAVTSALFSYFLMKYNSGALVVLFNNLYCMLVNIYPVLFTNIFNIHLSIYHPTQHSQVSTLDGFPSALWLVEACPPTMHQSGTRFSLLSVMSCHGAFCTLAC